MAFEQETQQRLPGQKVLLRAWQQQHNRGLFKIEPGRKTFFYRAGK
jgi:hypothetical protein